MSLKAGDKVVLPSFGGTPVKFGEDVNFPLFFPFRVILHLLIRLSIFTVRIRSLRNFLINYVCCTLFIFIIKYFSISSQSIGHKIKISI